MVIPEGVNHKQFYEAAQKKGVVVRSRFIGVAVNLNGRKNKKLHWMWRVQNNGQCLAWGRCSFTAEGELQANKDRLNAIEQLTTEGKLNVVRHYENKKSTYKKVNH